MHRRRRPLLARTLAIAIAAALVLATVDRDGRAEDRVAKC
jgi:hypothetical protein